MNPMAPTLKQLRYLVALAEHRNFRRAAEDCFISQPALSEQIQQLESLLNVQLVERSQRQVLITTFGWEIVERAREILCDVDDLVDLATRRQELFSTPMHMGVIPTIAPYLLPRILKKIRKAHPQLKLYLREEQTTRLLEQLRLGKLDFLILALPVEGADIESIELYKEEFVLISPKSNALAKKNTVRQIDLAQEQVLLLEEGHCLRDQALELCNSAGARESQEFRASSLNTLVQMVANGLGITLLPSLAVDIEVKGNTTLAVNRFAEPIPTRTIGLVWRKQTARRQEFDMLVKAIQKSIPPSVQKI